MSEFENQLRKLAVIPPPPDYESQARQLIKPARSQSRAPTIWALAATLVISLAGNVFMALERHSDTKPVPTEIQTSRTVYSQTQGMSIPGVKDAPQIISMEYF